VTPLSYRGRLWSLERTRASALVAEASCVQLTRTLFSFAGVRWRQHDAIGGEAFARKCSNFAKSAAIFKKNERARFSMCVTSPPSLE
jgi:hypothetical protein